MTAGTDSDVAPATDIEQLTVNTIRTLSMDAVQAANSGHPGTPMALAPVAYKLWQGLPALRPGDPVWPNRDRFVLSVGHASTLLYSMLHLAGVKSVNPDYEIVGEPAVSLEDIAPVPAAGLQAPRATPSTAGPPGWRRPPARWAGRRHQRRHGHRRPVAGRALQPAGLRAVRLRRLRAVRRRLPDGGRRAEAASLAGHLKLANLCWIYDNNQITIEGHTSLAFTEDVAGAVRRLRLERAPTSPTPTTWPCSARPSTSSGPKTERPTLIVVDSHIGYGSPNKAGHAAAHGEPLGEEEVEATKRFYGWPEDAEFLVPDGGPEHFAEGIGERGGELAPSGRRCSPATPRSIPSWPTQLDHDAAARAARGLGRRHPELPAPTRRAWPAATPRQGPERDRGEGAVAARRLGRPGAVDQDAARPSTGPATSRPPNRAGRNLHFGVREHAAAAVANGLALSKLRASGRVLDLLRLTRGRAMRLSALMELPVIHLFTHDSIGVGEDGPTHQPIEQLASLRAMPGADRHPPGRRQRGGRGLAGADATGTSRWR